MGNNVVEDNRTKSIETVIGYNARVAWSWNFSQPPIGTAPTHAWPGLMARLCTAQPSPITRAVMLRADAYYSAGCPLDLCEYAAARDLWSAMNPTKP